MRRSPGTGTCTTSASNRVPCPPRAAAAGDVARAALRPERLPSGYDSRMSDRRQEASKSRASHARSPKTKPRRFGLPPKGAAQGPFRGLRRNHTAVRRDAQRASATSLSRQTLERLFSGERLSTYIARCGGDFEEALDLYRWNAAVTAAFWEPIGHRKGTWLDDPCRDLTDRARDDIAAARFRVRQKGKRASEGQTISELSFGFWRFLITKRQTVLWPDLASAFPHAPNRRRETLEEPIARQHDFRNRLAHHQRIWSSRPQGRYDDLLAVASFIEPALPAWIEATSSVTRLLNQEPAQPVSS